ncbi:MAG: ABC transporter permease [Chloroflexota bacterium]|nr:ABC transporter permease [Chloroflexota bacterium]MDE2894391.1 ABC transporter permease [Chloroflexota bacterium]
MSLAEPTTDAVQIAARESWRDSPRVELALRVLRIYVRNRPAVFGAVILFGLGIVAAFAPIVAPYDPLKADLCSECVFQAPTLDHVAGTDVLGRDVLSRTIFGARIAWQVVVVAIGVAICIGVPTGLVAGYVGGKLDELLIMRIVDALMAMPALILILAMTAAVGPNIINTMMIIGIVWSAGYARLTRGVVLSIMQEPYVDAARCMGAGPRRIILRHLMPNVVAPVVVLASLSAAAIILVEAGLSFIGAGVQQPTPAWGGMVFEGYSNLFRSAWPIAAPGIAVVLMVVSFNFVGDGLRDAMDPRLRNIR